MKSYLISSVFSLSLISIAQAAELSIKEQCLALGYNTEISECEKAGSAALLCPLNDRTTKMAVCITDSCRGYPLYKKSGKFYYQDQAGNEVEAVPSKGQITDYMEGAFETCIAGYGDNAVTYYRVPKCKGEALYNNYFCDVGCDTEKKYPYTYHPGNTAGIVQKCVTADQTYYGYSSCNKGWVGGWSSSSGVGKCGLDDCNMVTYPYPVEPNAYHYGEERGKTETCKIGGSIYYRYRECKDNNFILKGSVCARKCEITNCTNTPFTNTYPNGDTAEINDWSCAINESRCQAGDVAVFQGKEIGLIGSISADKVYLLPINYTLRGLRWGDGVAYSINIPQLKDWDTTTSGKIQTKGVMLYKAGSGYSFSALEHCFNLDIGCAANSVCSKGEWFLPSVSELVFVPEIKYLTANVMGDLNFASRVKISSSTEQDAGTIRCLYYSSNINCNKMGDWVIPMLFFHRK